MNKIRWGLLSTAHINRRVIPTIRASQRGELVAVASRNIEKGKAYAAEWNIPRIFGGYDEMLTSGEIDAVYISLPNHLHAEWTIRALEAGVHVLCEKPFCLSINEVDQMTAASKSTGKILAEAFMYRHHPQTLTAKEWVQNGKLGDVHLVQGHFSFFMQIGSDNIRLAPEKGGGALWDVGVYPLSFAQYIYGRAPLSVSAVQRQSETGVDLTLAGQMDYGDEQMAQISCSFQIPFETYFTIHGTRGRLDITRPFTNINESKMTFTPIDGEAQEIPFSHLDPYLGEVEDTHAAIMDQQPCRVKLAESRDHIKTALALYESAKSGQVVQLG